MDETGREGLSAPAVNAVAVAASALRRAPQLNDWQMYLTVDGRDLDIELGTRPTRDEDSRHCTWRTTRPVRSGLDPLSATHDLMNNQEGGVGDGIGEASDASVRQWRAQLTLRARRPRRIATMMPRQPDNASSHSSHERQHFGLQSQQPAPSQCSQQYLVTGTFTFS
jgi:hypothetical protein